MMTKRIEVVRVKDLRPVDFVTGKRLALPRSEMKPCACCAKLCAILHVLTTGAEIGSECASVVTAIVTHGHEAALIGPTAKQTVFIDGGCR